MRGSLPALDGERALAGVSAPVTVARDANGVPTVKGTTRADVAGMSIVEVRTYFPGVRKVITSGA